MVERGSSFRHTVTPHLDPRAAQLLAEAARRVAVTPQFRSDPGEALADYVESELSYLTIDQQNLALVALAAAVEESAPQTLSDLDDEQQRELRLLMDRYEKILSEISDIERQLGELSDRLVANLT